MKSVLPYLELTFSSIIISLIALFLYFFSKTLAIRKVGFHTAWITLLFSIFAFVFCMIGNSHENSRSEAIIMAGIVNAKASPDRSGTDIFVLHEGTKVRITDSISDWVEIEVGNNKGWIPEKAAERI